MYAEGLLPPTGNDRPHGRERTHRRLARGDGRQAVRLPADGVVCRSRDGGPLDTGRSGDRPFRHYALAANHTRNRARWESPVGEPGGAQLLRDVALILILAMLFVLTLQIPRLTRGQRRERGRRRE